MTLSSINSFRTKISCINGMAGPVLKRECWHGTAIDVQTCADSNTKHTRRHDRLQSEESTFCTQSEPKQA